MLALTAECATIQVPENPREPKGRTIELFVARVPAISLNKKPDPLFLIAVSVVVALQAFAARAVVTSRARAGAAISAT